MKRISLSSAALMSALCFGGSAFAQEACRPSKNSCTAMYGVCQKTCATMTNPARCAAATCDVSVTECKSTGVWRARGARNACWTTSDRS